MSKESCVSPFAAVFSKGAMAVIKLSFPARAEVVVNVLNSWVMPAPDKFPAMTTSPFRCVVVATAREPLKVACSNVSFQNRATATPAGF